MTKYTIFCFMLSKINKSNKNLFPQGVGTYALIVTNNDTKRSKMITKNKMGRINFGNVNISLKNNDLSLIVTSNNNKKLINVRYTIISHKKQIKGKYTNYLPTKYNVEAEDMYGMTQKASGYYSTFSFNSERKNLNKNDIILLQNYTTGIFPRHPDL